MKIKPVLSTKQLTPLIEIIIVMVFFAGASVILVQVFAKAHNDSRFAHDINNATLFVGECAERIRLAEDYGGVLDALYSSGFEKNGDGHEFSAYLDVNFLPASGVAVYSAVTFDASVKDTEAGRLMTGQFVCMRNDGVELIRMDTAAFLQK